VVLVPEAETEEAIPYYHPKVRKIAYHYVEAPKKTIKSVFDDADDDDDDVKGSARRDGGSTAPAAQQFGTVSISILPFSPPSCPTSTSDSTATPPTADEVLPNRTFRTCLHLLETLHKHAFGSLVGYQKRVVHDVRPTTRRRFRATRLPAAYSIRPMFVQQVVVERTSFQDLYLVLKERHKHLDSQVQKKGSNKLLDVKRHVWKVSATTGCVNCVRDAVDRVMMAR
jgi:tRNASer (uridine44-2'-O)-methyltransferase